MQLRDTPAKQVAKNILIMSEVYPTDKNILLPSCGPNTSSQFYKFTNEDNINLRLGGDSNGAFLYLNVCLLYNLEEKKPCFLRGIFNPETGEFTAQTLENLYIKYIVQENECNYLFLGAKMRSGEIEGYLFPEDATTAMINFNEDISAVLDPYTKLIISMAPIYNESVPAPAPTPLPTVIPPASNNIWKTIASFGKKVSSYIGKIFNKLAQIIQQCVPQKPFLSFLGKTNLEDFYSSENPVNIYNMECTASSACSSLPTYKDSRHSLKRANSINKFLTTNHPTYFK